MQFAMSKNILKLGKNTIIYGFGSVIVGFIGLFTLPIFTSYLTTEEYGILSMLAVLSLLVFPIISLGLGPAMGPDYFKGNDFYRKSEVIWTSFLLLLISSLIVIILVILFLLKLFL